MISKPLIAIIRHYQNGQLFKMRLARTLEALIYSAPRGAIKWSEVPLRLMWGDIPRPGGHRVACNIDVNNRACTVESVGETLWPICDRRYSLQGSVGVESYCCASNRREPRLQSKE